MWLLYALLASLTYAALGLLMRPASQKSKDPRVFAFIFTTLATIILLFWSAVTSSFRIQSATAYLVLLFVIRVVLGAIFQRYQFSVRKHVEASVVQLVFTPTIISGYVLSIVWLNESVTPSNVLGLILILAGGTLIIQKKGKLEPNKYILLAIIIGICLSIASTIDKRTLSIFPLPLYMMLTWLGSAIFLYYPSISKKQIMTEWERNSWRIPILVALNIVGMTFNMIALKLGLASQVNPVLATTLILIVVGGIIFLGERDRLARKIIAAIIAYAGLILIAK